LIDLSEDNILKSLFDAKKDPLEVWKMLLNTHVSVQDAPQILSWFDTTYRCKSAFSLSYAQTQIKDR